MDLCVSAERLYLAMEHVSVDNKPKIVKNLTFPPTTAGKVNMIFTDLAVMEITPEGLLLKEVAPGLTAEDVQAVTESTLIISSDLKEMEF
jgi:acyl CoA:acetate/3-ketoacid CoA transferase beta subunit